VAPREPILTALLLHMAATPTRCTEPLTSADLEAARSFFGADESHPQVVELGGWGEGGLGDDAADVLAHLSVLLPKKLINRLCAVENRWARGRVADSAIS
jgi:hypothetical protein